MNSNLDHLYRILEHDAEQTIAMLNLVHAYDTRNATAEQDVLFANLHTAIVRVARRTIHDFTSREGKFNIDHPAWQLGIDTTAEGPDDHLCDETTLDYEGHYGAPGTGTAHKCRVCGKRWALVGETFFEEELGMHILKPEDVM